MRKSLYKPVNIIKELKSVEIDRPISSTDQCLYISIRNEKYLMGIDLDEMGLRLGLYIYKKDDNTGKYNRILDIVPEETNDNDFKIRVINDILEQTECISVDCKDKSINCYCTALDIYVY